MVTLEDLKGLPEADNKKCQPSLVKETATRPCIQKQEKPYIVERGGKEKIVSR